MLNRMIDPFAPPLQNNPTQHNAIKKKKEEEEESQREEQRRKMEKQPRGEEEERCSSPRKVKAQCIPRLRAPVANSSSCSARSHRFAPSSLLERCREAVFRLMMLSALSRPSSSPPPQPPPPPPPSSQRRPYYPVNEPHHSEALADCIEFINRKKKASDADADAAAISGGPLDAPAEMVMPVPVM